MPNFTFVLADSDIVYGRSVEALRSQVVRSSVRPSVRSSCERHIVKRDKPMLMLIDTSSPRGKAKWSTLGVRRSKFKVTRGGR